MRSPPKAFEEPGGARPKVIALRSSRVLTCVMDPIRPNVDPAADPAGTSVVVHQFEPVCPRCGHPVADHEYCPTCGLHLHVHHFLEPAASGQSATALRVLAGVIAALALVACGLAIWAIASQPSTSGLRQQIASLSAHLQGTRKQLSALDASVTHGPARSNLLVLQTAVSQLKTSVGRLQGSVGHLNASTNALGGSIAGLQRTVGSLKASTTTLLNCVPELQQELNGLTVTKPGGKFQVNNPTIVSGGCTTLLPGH